jgi:glyoxylase-like metal-dependent hydrolase (beta-lactamase superfamily II)
VWPIATKARALGDWVASKDRNLTDIFITHGQGDHWFASGLLAERFVRAIQRDSM